MGHSVTVCAKRREIGQFRLRARLQLVHGIDVVNLDVAVAQLSIPRSKIKIANLAGKFAGKLRLFALFSHKTGVTFVSLV